MTDKKVTIKGATDEQLNALISRLSREYDLMRLVRDIKRLSTPNELREFMDRHVSTEVPVEELYHYGVKGMKWGVRKGSEDYKIKQTRKAASKGRRSLSDADIEKRIKRLQSEKKLKELTDADVAPGKTAVKKILSSSGQKSAGIILTGATLLAVRTAVSGKFDREAAGKLLTTIPKK